MSPSGTLPIFGLLALAMTGFIAIMTETLPAGLLNSISSDLGISAAFTGQLVTMYAIGSMLAAIPLTAATRGWDRRTALLTAIVGFLIFNSITALSANVIMILCARFMAGAAAGLAWGLIAGYARRMVQPHQQGRAMSIAMVGTPLALSLGVPLGTWLGNIVGWRMAFGMMSVLTLILIVWVIRCVPNYPGQAKTARKPLRAVFTQPGIRSILLVIVIWMMAHNLLYTYIAPFLRPAGLENRVDQILLIFGCSALVGIWLTGMVVDRWLRNAVLLSIAGFALTSLGLGLAGTSATAVLICTALWGLTFGGAATLLQTALGDAAGPDADLAQSMLVVAWNLAMAGGGLFGGLFLQSPGISAFPWIILLLLVPCFIVAYCAHRHGFKRGPRMAALPLIESVTRETVLTQGGKGVNLVKYDG